MRRDWYITSFRNMSDHVQWILMWNCLFYILHFVSSKGLEMMGSDKICTATDTYCMQQILSCNTADSCVMAQSYLASYCSSQAMTWLWNMGSVPMYTQVTQIISQLMCSWFAHGPIHWLADGTLEHPVLDFCGLSHSMAQEKAAQLICQTWEPTV